MCVLFRTLSTLFLKFLQVEMLKQWPVKKDSSVLRYCRENMLFLKTLQTY